VPAPVKVEPQADRGAATSSDDSAGHEAGDGSTDSATGNDASGDDADREPVRVTADTPDPVRVSAADEQGPDDSRSGSGDDNSGPGSGDDSQGESTRGHDNSDDNSSSSSGDNSSSGDGSGHGSDGLGGARVSAKVSIGL